MIDLPINQIIVGDCLEVMRGWPDKCIDAIITDPPYGVGLQYESYKDTKENHKSLIAGFMDQALRVAKRVLVTPGTSNMWTYPPPKWVLCWHYGTTNAMNPWGFTSWQPILAYGADPYLENCLGPRMDVISDSHSKDMKIMHPCPKPIEFSRKYVLRGSALQTDIICDPFCGSGSILLAAEEHGRKWIGIEIEPKYAEIARQRIAKEQAQGKLFT